MTGPYLRLVVERAYRTDNPFGGTSIGEIEFPTSVTRFFGSEAHADHCFGRGAGGVDQTLARYDRVLDLHSARPLDVVRSADVRVQRPVQRLTRRVHAVGRSSLWGPAR